MSIAHDHVEPLFSFSCFPWKFHQPLSTSNLGSCPWKLCLAQGAMLVTKTLSALHVGFLSE